VAEFFDVRPGLCTQPQVEVLGLASQAVHGFNGQVLGADLRSVGSNRALVRVCVPQKGQAKLPQGH